MRMRGETVARMDERVSRLNREFRPSLDAFSRSEAFTGPSLYFHRKTIALLRSFRSPVDALGAGHFAEALYATLTAWGMHRMGRNKTKLVEFPEFHASLREQAERVAALEGITIWAVPDSDVPGTASQVWELIRSLRVGIGQSKIVAGSKTLHHILPDLVPPIDETYTMRFFFQRRRDDREAFELMYPRFVSLAISNRRVIESVLGTGMNSSSTKVLDNAVVGYVLKHLPRVKRSTTDDPTC